MEINGGNPNLGAEKSDSYTYGVVLQPHWIPGLTASVDYYNIKAKNVISALDAQTILDQCYDNATLNNSYCALIQRNTAPSGPRLEIPFQILEGTLIASTANFAQLRARGFDAKVANNHDFGNIGAISARVKYTHVLQRDDFFNPNDPKEATRLRGTLGTPIDRFRLISNFTHGPVTLGYTLRWIGQQYVDIYANYFAINGNPPAHPFYASLTRYPVIAYHDSRGSIDIDKRFNFYLGVDNVGGKLPPYGLSGIGGGSGIYDNRGRFIDAWVEAKFLPVAVPGDQESSGFADRQLSPRHRCGMGRYRMPSRHCCKSGLALHGTP